ncbi:DUF2946 family protein [Phenylobacterium sp.]|uniref:DUF2946 family protein n=1 Tax=Phenylobacterium sp. TaxID=1871053 RepID=UPI0035AEB621
MNRFASTEPNRLRRVWLTLAMLAVALKVMIPAGFMTAGPQEADLPFALVLCTAQGAVTVDPGDLPGHSDDAPTERHDSPCAFAGHGAPLSLPNLIDAVRVEFVAYRAPAAVPVRQAVAPGRGLAAPPLPARGPPSLLI